MWKNVSFLGKIYFRLKKKYSHRFPLDLSEILNDSYNRAGGSGRLIPEEIHDQNTANDDKNQKALFHAEVFHNISAKQKNDDKFLS